MGKYCEVCEREYTTYSRHVNTTKHKETEAMTAEERIKAKVEIFLGINTSYQIAMMRNNNVDFGLTALRRRSRMSRSSHC